MGARGDPGPEKRPSASADTHLGQNARDERQDETERPASTPRSAARTTHSQASRADNADALRGAGRWDSDGGAPPTARPRAPRPRPPRLSSEGSPAPDLSGPLLALGVPPRHKPRPHALRPAPALSRSLGAGPGGSAPRRLKGWQFWEGGPPCPPFPPPPPLGPPRVRTLSRKKDERSGWANLQRITLHENRQSSRVPPNDHVYVTFLR